MCVCVCGGGGDILVTTYGLFTKVSTRKVMKGFSTPIASGTDVYRFYLIRSGNI